MSPTLVPPRLINRTVCIPAGAALLPCSLTVPREPRALVVIANAGGDRSYKRVNRATAAALAYAGFATLEVNLRTPEETAAVLVWANRTPAFQTLDVGVFATGPCAAGVLVAAAEYPDLIQSVISCFASPELAGSALADVQAPVLLLLGERDIAHRDDYRMAMTVLPPRSHLEIIPDARHLLHDILRVADLAARWFGHTLTSRPTFLRHNNAARG
jgi:putative phosphoribosyl transferase